MNLVSTTAVFSLKEPINIKKYKLLKGEVGRKFHAFKLKLREGGCALVFKKGKVVLVGNTKIYKAALEVSKELRKEITKLPIVKNSVYSGRLTKRIDLTETCKALQASGDFIASYECELFPSLFANEKGKKSTIQLCLSGVYVITGVIEEDEAKSLRDKCLRHIIHIQR